MPLLWNEFSKIFEDLFATTLFRGNKKFDQKYFENRKSEFHRLLEITVLIRNSMKNISLSLVDFFPLSGHSPFSGRVVGLSKDPLTRVREVFDLRPYIQVCLLLKKFEKTHKKNLIILILL